MGYKTLILYHKINKIASVYMLQKAKCPPPTGSCSLWKTGVGCQLTKFSRATERYLIISTGLDVWTWNRSLPVWCRWTTLAPIGKHEPGQFNAVTLQETLPGRSFFPFPHFTTLASWSGELSLAISSSISAMTGLLTFPE